MLILITYLDILCVYTIEMTFILKNARERKIRYHESMSSVKKFLGSYLHLNIIVMVR